MRILYVTDEYPGLTRNFGGIAMVFQNEVTFLRKSGYNVEVLLFTKNKLERNLPCYVKQINRPIKGSFKGLRARLQLFYHIYRNYNRKDKVVVHDFGGLIPFWIRSEKIVQLHNCSTLMAIKQKRKISKINWFLEWLNIISANKIRAVSNSVLNDTRKHFPFSKLIPSIVIHNGIQTIKSVKSNKFNSVDNNDIIFIGKLSKVKGVHFLQHIINDVHLVNPETRFIIIGHDELKYGISQRKELRKKLRSPEKVSFINRIDNSEVYSYLENSKLLILPSMTEALPMVVIEAFAASRPVVAFNIGGLNEMIDNGINGYLIDSFNIDQFVEAIIMILSNDALASKFEIAAYNKYLSDFTLEQTTARLIELYNS